MAALIRSTRIPLWSLYLRYRSPNILRGFQKCCQPSDLSNLAPIVYATRCVSTSECQHVNAAAAVVSESHGGQQVDRMINSLDKNVRKFGRLSLSEIEKVLAQLEENGSVTNTQSLLLIRCMGSTLAEVKQQDRTVILEQMCARLKRLGAVFGVQHYNALLRVYLQNEHKFSPTDFLSTLESENIPANRVTYQRLVARYCLDGDIQGASQILEHMKTKELPINEQVFSALVTGHFRANDVTSALGILDIMRQAGVEAGPDTYSALLNGYAETGDLIGIKDIMKRAEENGVTLMPNVLFTTLLTLAKNGKETEAYEFLPQIEKLPGYGVEAMSCSLQLIALGLDDLAFTVFSCTGKPVVYDKEDSTMGRFLIRGMVRAERPPGKIDAMLEKMRNEQFNNDTIAIVAQFAYNNLQTDYAMKILDYMKTQGFPIRAHYFWPAICQYRDQGNIDKLKLVTQNIRSLCDSPDDLFQTLDSFVLPAFLQLGIKGESLYDTLKASSFTPETVNFAYMLHLVRTEGLEKALEYGRNNPLDIMYGAVRPLLVPIYKKSKDVEPVLQVLTFINESGKMPRLSIETNGWFLMDFCNNINKLSEIETVIMAMKDKNLKVFNQDVEEVKSFCVRSNQSLSPDAENALNSLSTQGNFNRRPRITGEELSNMETIDLEKQLEKNPENKGVLKSLLVKYCQEGNVEAAEKMKAQLDATGFVYASFVLRHLAFMAAHFKEDLSEAQGYLKQLNDQYPEFQDYCRVILAMANIHVKNGNTEEALKVCQDYCDSHEEFLAEKKVGFGYSLEESISNVVEVATDNNQMTFAKEFVELVFDKKLIRSGAANVLRKYLQGFLKNDDSDGCVEALSWIISSYGKTPAVNDLMKFLIKKEDPERLQKVVDLLTTQRGEMNVLHQLMIAFVECGDLKKAKKIADTPGLRAVMTVLSNACAIFVRDRRLKELEDLVSITKNLFATDRDEMLFHLIRYHAITENWPKALSVLVDYEEEGLQPKPRTLRYLAKALEGANQPVPFEVPRPLTDDDDFARVEGKLTPAEQRAVSLIASGGFSAVEDIRNDLKLSGNEEQASRFLKHIASFLLEQRRYKEHSSLLRHLSSNGDVEALLDLKSLDVPEKDKVFISQNLLQAYVNSNRSEEILNLLEENLEEADNHFSDAGFRLLVQKNPETLPKLEELAKKTSENGFYKISNHLWTHYIKQNDSERADVILKENPEMIKDLRVLNACRYALDTKQVDKLSELVNLLRNKNPVGVQIVYRHILQYYVTNQDPESLQKVLKQCTEDEVSFDDYHQRVRNSIISCFQSHGKPIPQELAFSATKSDTSDHSSSSSDDERKPEQR